MHGVGADLLHAKVGREAPASAFSRVSRQRAAGPPKWKGRRIRNAAVECPQSWTLGSRRFTARFREGFIAFVEELPGANTQGATLEEARTNLEEAVALVLEANPTLAAEDLKGADVIGDH